MKIVCTNCKREINYLIIKNFFCDGVRIVFEDNFIGIDVTSSKTFEKAICPNCKKEVTLLEVEFEDGEKMVVDIYALQDLVLKLISFKKKPLLKLIKQLPRI